MAHLVTSKPVLLFGGSSGMGKAAAKACVRAGMRVALAGRDAERLAAAADEVQRDTECASSVVETHAVDLGNEAALAAFFSAFGDGSFSHLVCTVGPSANCSSVLGADGLAGLRRQFDLKFFAQLAAVSYGASKVADGGALVLCSGALAKRPGKGSTALAAANAALDAVRPLLRQPRFLRSSDSRLVHLVLGRKGPRQRPWAAPARRLRVARPDGYRDVGQAARREARRHARRLWQRSAPGPRRNLGGCGRCNPLPSARNVRHRHRAGRRRRRCHPVMLAQGLANHNRQVQGSCSMVAALRRSRSGAADDAVLRFVSLRISKMYPQKAALPDRKSRQKFAPSVRELCHATPETAAVGCELSSYSVQLDPRDGTFDCWWRRAGSLDDPLTSTMTHV